MSSRKGPAREPAQLIPACSRSTLFWRDGSHADMASVMLLHSARTSSFSRLTDQPPSRHRGAAPCRSGLIIWNLLAFASRASCSENCLPASSKENVLLDRSSHGSKCFCRPRESSSSQVPTTSSDSHGKKLQAEPAPSNRNPTQRLCESFFSTPG